MKVSVIAEAGVNHNGQEDLALDLVKAAHDSGADTIKFQTFTAKSLVTKSAKLANYQMTSTRKNSQYQMLSQLELERKSHFKLVDLCQKLGIEFLSSAFDSDSMNFLVKELGVTRLKIPSGELTNAPLLLEHAATGKELIVSTGMACLAEIEAALGVIAFGYTASEYEIPSINAFQNAYASNSGQIALKNKVTLLHCTTEYPTPLSEVNLKAMNTLSDAFALPVGYSDHSKGEVVAIAAVARGASIIEKHLTLDKTFAGPDHRASLEPKEFKDLVTSIRETEIVLGSPVKFPSTVEIPNMDVARKSLVAASFIKVGEVFTPLNLCVKRPGTGASPYDYWALMEKKSKNDYKPGDLISE